MGVGFPSFFPFPSSRKDTQEPVAGPSCSTTSDSQNYLRQHRLPSMTTSLLPLSSSHGSWSALPETSQKPPSLSLPGASGVAILHLPLFQTLHLPLRRVLRAAVHISVATRTDAALAPATTGTANTALTPSSSHSRISVSSSSDEAPPNVATSPSGDLGTPHRSLLFCDQNRHKRRKRLRRYYSAAAVQTSSPPSLCF